MHFEGNESVSDVAEMGWEWLEFGCFYVLLTPKNTVRTTQITEIGQRTLPWSFQCVSDMSTTLAK